MAPSLSGNVPTSVETETALWKSVKNAAYGAKGDGVTNDDAAFAAWVNALNVSGGGHGFVPPGRYILTLPWPTITQSGVVIDLSPGAILDFSAAATNSKFIAVQGTEGATVALTANAAEGATSLSVAAGAETPFTGSYLRLASTAVWDAGRTNTPIGEQALCTTTTSGVINLWTPTAIGPYNTVDAAVASPITHNTSFVFRGGTIIGGGSGANHQPIYLDKCRDALITDTIIKSCDAIAVTVLDSIDVIVSKCRFYDIDSLVTGTGYGVSWTNTATDCLVVDCYFKNAKHATTSASTAGRSGIALRCGARDCTLWGNVNTGDGFDTHACGLDIFYEYCRVYGVSGQGINIECPRARVIGCQVYRSAQNGIGFHNESTQPTDYEARGNKVYYALAGSNGAGIQYTQASTAGAGQVIRQVIIAENVVYASAGNAITAYTNGTYRANSVSIVGNIINAPGGHGILMQYVDQGVIANNIVKSLPTGKYGIQFLSCTQASVTGNAVQAASATTTTGVYVLTSSTSCSLTGNVITGCATGILLDNTSSNCSLTANDPSGCTTLFNLGTGTGHMVTDNQWGASPPAATNLTAGITASPYVFQNTTGRRIQLAVNGGTVSNIKYSRDNVSFYNTATSGLFVLDPGDYLQITYTAAPTTFEQFPLR